MYFTFITLFTPDLSLDKIFPAGSKLVIAEFHSSTSLKKNPRTDSFVAFKIKVI